MLPTGHVAAGYLTGVALLKLSNPALPPEQMTQLLWWAIFFGFAPDIDVFYFFIKNKTMLVGGKEANQDIHRKYGSHAPIWWLVSGLLIFFLSPSVYWKFVGLLLWLGSWSHFLLDSIEYGITWLSPFNKKLYAIKNREYKMVLEERNFIKHVFKYLKLYSTRLTFYLEVIIIISALTIYF